MEQALKVPTLRIILSKSQFTRSNERKERATKITTLSVLNSRQKDLESKLGDANLDMHAQKVKFQEEKRQLQHELQSLQEILDERRIRRLQALKKNAIIESKLSKSAEELQNVPTAANEAGINNFQTRGAALGAETHKNTYTVKRPKRLNPVFKRKVIAEDVANISERLWMKLLFERIPINEALQVISQNSDADDEISIVKLKEVLLGQPFAILDQSDAEIAARYLVEDNQDLKVIYDEKLTQPSVIVKSILRKMLNCYDLPTQKEEELMKSSIFKVIQANQQRLAADFASMKHKIGEYCTKEQLINVFKANDIVFDHPTQSLMISSLYGLSKDSKRLPFYSLLTSSRSSK